MNLPTHIHSSLSELSADSPRPVEDALSVTEFTTKLQRVLEQGVPACWIHGEISNFTEATSGHWYFNLKEAQAQIRCVMFRSRQIPGALRPKNGLAVKIHGSVSYYAPNGSCQILVDFLLPAGQGVLYEAFNRLKTQLTAQGLFEASRKRPLPFLPRNLGVLTSPAAAAWRDVLTTLQRRAPFLSIILYPIPVQGEGAAPVIAQRLEQAGIRNECDVLLICRGGGSMEDLWAFNEEVVVRAIAACPLPVVTGIGHETDFTLADFVADQRAPTPTAAAEMVCPELAALNHHLLRSAQRMSTAWRRRVELHTLHLDQRRQRWEALYRRYWEQQHHHLRLLGQRLIHPGQQLEQRRQNLRALESRWQQSTQRWLERQRHRLEAHQRALAHLNPRGILQRGYALVLDAQGRIVEDADQLESGQQVRLTLARGQRDACILPQTGDNA
ncbi:MAG: exodeoxyribonuclease VII large subunit [Ferrovum sp.]|nr:exodeoxyribonuclease VII large subunit [Ferrovum sp.]NDU86824.1 exodeoxyribonuclease VII large subunit [Ferrovum sp.]